MQLCFSVVGQLIKSTVIMWSLCKWNRDCGGLLRQEGVFGACTRCWLFSLFFSVCPCQRLISPHRSPAAPRNQNLNSLLVARAYSTMMIAASALYFCTCTLAQFSSSCFFFCLCDFGVLFQKHLISSPRESLQSGLKTLSFQAGSVFYTERHTYRYMHTLTHFGHKPSFAL